MASRNPDRPNIVFILADDLGHWALGCAGNSEVRTPAIDRLAAQGIRFDNFFCVSPVCSPARASILTGRIPSRHGVHDWLRCGNSTVETERGGELIEYLKGQAGFTDVLAAGGYACGLSGKWHLGNAHSPQKGFTFWEAYAKGSSDYYNAPMIKKGKVRRETRYVTDVITDNGLLFLEDQEDTETPFCLCVHYTAPHSPWGRNCHPAELYDDYYDNCPFASTPDEPMHPRHVNTAPCPADAAERRKHLSGYFAATTAMDSNIARVMDWLDAKALRENTMVVFTSDNGMNMGHHGIWGKGNGTYPMNMYDTSVKVPFIVSRPGRVLEGVANDDLLSHYDVMPTLLDCAGMELPADDRLPGRSFAPLLAGHRLPAPGPVVVYDEYGPVRMIRDRQWKYVHRYPYGPRELYDLEADPGEKNDLAARPEHAEQVRRMKAALEEWFARFADPAVDGRSEPVSGRGQLGLAGPAANGEHNYGCDIKHVPGGEPVKF